MNINIVAGTNLQKEHFQLHMYTGMSVNMDNSTWWQ